jgi:F420-dependent oxidoreductase-like protein
VTLGVGVTHQIVSEGAFGIPYREALARCRDELVGLSGLLGESRSADYDGETLSVHAKFPSAMPAPRLVLAALGPRMLDLAGELTDGTVTWMTGPAALGRQVVPRLAAAAAAHGRPQPVVVVGLPVCVTDDVADARVRIGAQMAGSAALPSYRRMLAAEEVSEPVDIALIGGPGEIAARIARLAEAGATELLAYVQGTEDEQRATVEQLPGLVRGATG